MDLKIDQKVRSIQLEIETPEAVIAAAEQIAKKLSESGLGIRTINFSVSYKTWWDQLSTELRSTTTVISAIGFAQPNPQENK